MISAAEPVPLRITAGTSCWIFRCNNSIVPGVPRTSVQTIGKPSSLQGFCLFSARASPPSRRGRNDRSTFESEMRPVVTAAVGSVGACCWSVSWWRKSSNRSRNRFVALSSESVNFSKGFSVFSLTRTFLPGLFSKLEPIGCSRIMMKCVWSLFKDNWSRLRAGTLTS